MAEVYTPVMRVLVAAALLLASVTVMLVTLNTARAAGALAVGSCGAYGEAYDFRNIAAASKSALGKCQGDSCRVVATVARGCAAFAVDFVDPCGAQGWAKGARLGINQNAALKSCYQDGGKECVIRTFFCDARG